MTYRVALYPPDGGFAVSCPGLPGCWSEGSTEAEALDNIRDAIAEYVAIAQELAQQDDAELRTVEVTV